MKKIVSTLLAIVMTLSVIFPAVASAGDITSVTPKKPKTIDSKGSVSYTIRGTDINQDDIKVKSEPVGISYKVEKSTVDAYKAEISFPENKTGKEVTYTLSFSADKGQTYPDEYKRSVVVNSQSGVSPSPETSEIKKPLLVKNAAKYFIILEEPKNSEFNSNGGTLKFRYDSTGIKADQMQFMAFKDDKYIKDFKFLSVIAHDDQAMNGIEYTASLPKNVTEKDEVYEIFIKEKKDENYDQRNVVKVTVKGKTEKVEITGLSHYRVEVANNNKDMPVLVDIKGSNLTDENIKYQVKKQKETNPDLIIKINPEFLYIPTQAEITVPENKTKEDFVYRVNFYVEGSQKRYSLEIIVKGTENTSPGESEPQGPEVKELPNNPLSDLKLTSEGGNLSFRVATTGEVENEKIKLYFELDGKKTNLNYVVTGNKTVKTVELSNVPKNDTASPKVYTIKFNATGSSENFQDSPVARLTVEGAENPVQADFKELNINKSLPLTGGNQKVNIKGENLTKAQISLELFKKEEGKFVKVELDDQILVQMFVGGDKVQSALLNIPASDKEESYKVDVTVAGVKKSEEFKLEASGTTKPLVCIAPKSAFTTGENKLMIQFHGDVFQVKEDSIKLGFKIQKGAETISIGKEDKVNLQGSMLEITFKEPVFKDKAVYKLIAEERVIKDSLERQNQAFEYVISPDHPSITKAEITKGYQNTSTGGEVEVKLEGYNLPKELKIKILENNKEKTPIYIYGGRAEDNVIKNLQVTGDSSKKTIKFTAPENKTSQLKTYSILISVDGGKIYSSDWGATLNDRFKRLVVAVLAKDENPDEAKISFIQIQSYGTQGGWKEADITHTNLPTGQESKKTLLWIYGTNLDAKKSKLRLKDANGVYWSPIHDSTFDSSDRILMTMMDGMKDGKSFGMSGSGNNMLMEVILPNAYAPDDPNANPKGVTFTYEVSPDSINYDTKNLVTGTVVDDLTAGKKVLKDLLMDVTVRHVDEKGKDLVDKKEIKAYKNLPPNVFHFMLPLVDEKGDFREDFIGYKVKDTEEIVCGEQGFGQSKHYYYEKNIPKLINSNKEIVLVYKAKEDPNPEPQPIPVPVNKLTELKGTDRYQTAVEISKKNFEKAETVILASGENFPDALAAASLAGIKNAPLLLTEKGGVPTVVKEEIQRLGAKNIILLGGEKAIDATVEKAFEGKEVERLAGADRYQTAAKITELVQKAHPEVKTVILADGRNYPDAMAVGSYAAKNGIGILLADGESLAKETAKAIENMEKVIIVGGEASVPEKIEKAIKAMGKEVERLAGADRYQTAAKIAENLYPEAKKVVIASGEVYADALAGAAAAAKENAPILIVRNSEIPTEVKRILESYKLEKIAVLGGEKTIGQRVREELNKLVR